MKEIKIIKQLIKSFNNGRAKIWKFKDLIKNYNVKKPNIIQFKPPSAEEEPQSRNNISIRLANKASPYGKEEFKEISLKAFFSTHIRELFTNRETNPDSTEEISDAINKVISKSSKIEKLKDHQPSI